MIRRITRYLAVYSLGMAAGAWYMGLTSFQNSTVVWAFIFLSVVAEIAWRTDQMTPELM